MKPAVLLALMFAAATGVASAQLTRPGLRLPQLPQLPQNPGILNPATAVLQQGLDESLTGNRLRTAQLLIRRNSQSIEGDPNGDPIVRAQLVAFDLPEAALKGIVAAGFTVASQQTLDGLGLTLTVLNAPRGTSTPRALRRLRKLQPSASFDYNHIYAQSAVQPVAGSTPFAAAAPDAAAARAVSAAARVGLIDGGINAAHAAFRDVAFKSWGCKGDLVPTAHGTAVGSLMVGSDGAFHGAAPGADLYAADVYCGQATGGSIDLIAQALQWLHANQVPVINISLVGPANAILRELVQAMTAQGHLIVAAVGNDGPAAPPLYPAAYPEVIGVTAVDRQRHVLFEAGRGRQVHFAAPGADMAAASYPRSYDAVRGTSFAAPIVAGLLALQLHELDAQAARTAIRSLERAAVDAGSQGLDDTYGYGVVGEALRIAPDIMQLASK